MGPFTVRAIALAVLIGVTYVLWKQSSFSPVLDTATDGSKSRHEASLQTVARRVVAVADLHGDLEHAHNVLRMARLVDNKQVEPGWIGGHDVLVSTGDIVDRGDDTIPLYHMFQRLRDQARAAGGDVRNCIGNHEMMNALMDWRYVTQGDFDSFGGKAKRRHAMSTDGWVGRDWLANYSISHTIPLLPLEQLPTALQQSAAYTPIHASFVHGGIHPQWAARGLEEVNTLGHSLLRKALEEARPNGWLPADATEEEKSLYSEHGPLWYRGYALEDEADVCHEAKLVTRDLGVKHLVMGHTPHLSGFVVRCRGKVLLIDTGISRAYGGEQSALIFDTRLEPQRSLDGDSKAQRWTESSTITALYRGRMPKILRTHKRTVEV